ncbi:response regulator transcription factor [Streptomonospora sp. PA3]|uniref:response regulator transcription factor n=1 Tax=Streptomonospora sp. PA3 TaxID=2607326 RepID=UPI0013079E2D|nr:response regulator transcription factor [Streptomonospora sp. PA3]
MVTPAPVRVLLADDEPGVRAGLRTVLAADPGIEVAAEAADGREVLGLLARHRIGVVLLDIRMPVLDGLAALAELRRRDPAQRVVILTTYGERDYVLRAVALDANGFLLKSGDPYELLQGVRAVAAGGTCLSPSVAAMVVSDLRSRQHDDADRESAQGRLAGLPPREQAVLRGIAAGRSNAEIAGDLRVTETTVKGYTTALFARLGVRNRVEAALAAWQAGWRER